MMLVWQEELATAPDAVPLRVCQWGLLVVVIEKVSEGIDELEGVVCLS